MGEQFKLNPAKLPHLFPHSTICLALPHISQSHWENWGNSWNNGQPGLFIWPNPATSKFSLVHKVLREREERSCPNVRAFSWPPFHLFILHFQTTFYISSIPLGKVRGPGTSTGGGELHFLLWEATIQNLYNFLRARSHIH